jgi:hypothetical protein
LPESSNPVRHPATNQKQRNRMTSHIRSNKQEQGQQSCNQTLFLWCGFFGMVVYLKAAIL